ncbi:MAG: IS3 family transposase, partial [Pseudobutyrivibrio sp.]|nr:IS3 family transposase [Pseudobutyrivibrio sp.]
FAPLMKKTDINSISNASSPNNSACEGFFGHLKTEMFYGHNWDDYSIKEFI